MIPTAEELLRSIISNCGMESHEVKEFNPELWDEMVESIKEQNKLHVKAALEAASEEVGNTNDGDYFVQMILEAYPLTNIK